MELVQVENGQVYTNSLMVATAFGKQHKNVIQNIDILITNMNVLKSEENDLNIIEIGDEEVELKIQPYLKDKINPNIDENLRKFFIQSEYI